MFNIYKRSLLFAIICLISGFFLTLQLQILSSNTITNPLSQKTTNLVTIIKDLEEEIKNHESYIENARNELNELQLQQSKGNLLELQTALKDAKIKAGLTPVIGPGIIVTVDDNKEGLKAKPDDNPNKYIIHYEHILNIISDLKFAGAEAISVNDQRLITTSEIRCVGNVILINTSRIAPPFVISAIGSPKLMSDILNNGELEMLKASNYPVSIQESNEVIIPAYKSELQFNHSQISKEG